MARLRSSSGTYRSSADAEAGLGMLIVYDLSPHCIASGWLACMDTAVVPGWQPWHVQPDHMVLIHTSNTYMLACVTGDVSSTKFTVDDALNRCGTWDAFHWLMLFYCGLSWMCDVSQAVATQSTKQAMIGHRQHPACSCGWWYLGVSRRSGLEGARRQCSHTSCT